MKKLLALLLAFGLLGGAIPVLAAEGEPPAPVPDWAYRELADSYAMGLIDDSIIAGHGNTVTQEQLDALTKIAADKLALLNVPANLDKGEPVVIDTTRGGVLNALYQEAAAYAFEGVNAGAIDFLRALGVVSGDGSSLALERPCTLLEAAVFANRLILALYDGQNAGSLGLLWKAEGNGNTLYLLGSIHTDRSNLYPFHKQLRDIIKGSELAAFELDFNSQEGIDEFTAMQVYSDGTTLKEHIDAELYQEVVKALAPLGMSEEDVARFKPWALANSFTALSMTDDTTSDNAMAIDLYVNAMAVNMSIPVEGIETYAFQGSIFDNLSEEFQEDYLAMTLTMFQGMDAAGDLTEEEKAALEEALKEQNAIVDTWMNQW